MDFENKVSRVSSNLQREHLMQFADRLNAPSKFNGPMNEPSFYYSISIDQQPSVVSTNDWRARVRRCRISM